MGGVGWSFCIINNPTFQIKTNTKVLIIHNFTINTMKSRGNFLPCYHFPNPILKLNTNNKIHLKGREGSHLLQNNFPINIQSNKLKKFLTLPSIFFNLPSPSTPVIPLFKFCFFLFYLFPLIFP